MDDRNYGNDGNVWRGSRHFRSEGKDPGTAERILKIRKKTTVQKKIQKNTNLAVPLMTRDCGVCFFHKCYKYIKTA
jgi:hypothetical protein